MPKSLKQKEKLLRILEILERKTDEDHYISTRELIEELSKYDIEAERKSIYDDIDVLKNMGYDIRLSKVKDKSGYSLLSRRLDKSEIMPLVDAVACSRFITEKKSRKLIKKLEGFLSVYEAGALNRDVLVTDRIKSENESIFYVTDAVSTAIAKKVYVTFKYCEYNVDKKLVERNKGKIYKVFPLTLSWNDERYYIIGVDFERNEIRHYRCDKIKDINVTSEPLKDRSPIEGFDIVNYENMTFGMYGGEKEAVTLSFPEKLCGVIIDRFGKEPTFRKHDNGIISARVNVNVSPQFYGWLLGLGPEVKIMGPDNVKENFKKYLKNVYDLY